MTGHSHDEEPVLDVVLDEIKNWAARTAALDARTTLSIHAKTAAILTVVQIALFAMAAKGLASWTMGQWTCLLPLVPSYLAARFRERPQDARTTRLNHPTLLVPPFITTLLVVPFVLIIGIPKSTGTDLAVYALSVIATLTLLQTSWRLAVRRTHGR